MRLLLAGAGPEEAPLAAWARERGIDGDVEFLGSVADVPALLARCSFTVLPSLSEGMPNAVLESLAHGRAVVASAVGGVPEILDQAEVSLSRRESRMRSPKPCRLYWQTRHLAARLGAEGRDIVHERFGIDRMVDESTAAVQGLLAGRSPHEASRDQQSWWTCPVKRAPRQCTRLPLDGQIARRDCATGASGAVSSEESWISGKENSR